jgi:hypothetical protein
MGVPYLRCFENSSTLNCGSGLVDFAIAPAALHSTTSVHWFHGLAVHAR